MQATLTDPQSVAPLRRLFLAERPFQIRHESCHSRGWADYYLLQREGETVGYGAIKGQDITARDTIFEFFLLPAFRAQAVSAFSALIAGAQPSWIEGQSNDMALFAMMGIFGRDMTVKAILFESEEPTKLKNPAGVVFRPRRAGEPVFRHHAEPEGQWLLEEAGEIVATGGFLTHYNAPFADLHMEVVAARRRRGLGSFLVQELQAECRRQGLTPAARCDIHNAASMATLGKAGMRPCGLMLLVSVI